MNKKEESKKVAVEVGAEAYAAAERIARAMNRVDGNWLGDDNTAESVIGEFALVDDITSLEEAVVYGVCTDTEDGDLDFERRNALRLAIAAEAKARYEAEAVGAGAKLADFAEAKADRAERLLKAVKPVTDKWYPRFRDMADCGDEELFGAWKEYEAEVIGGGKDADDLFFRFAAADMMLNSLNRGGFEGAAGLHPGVSDLVTHLEHFNSMQFHDFHARGAFGIGRDGGVALGTWVSIVIDIDTLGLEYGEVA